MPKKYYGVYKEGTLLKFDNWPDCQSWLNKEGGHIVYTSFKTEPEVDDWLDQQRRWRKNFDTKPPHVYTAFVDGSVREFAGDPMPSYGVAIYNEKNELVHESCGVKHQLLSDDKNTRNELGELVAAQVAAQWAKQNNKEVLIVYDYEGICCYPSGTWKPKSKAAKNYVTAMLGSYNKHIYGMQWIKGHGDGDDFLTLGNAHADELASRAFDEISER